MKAIDVIRQAILDGRLLNEETFDGFDVDLFFEGRDDAEFERKWLHADEVVGASKLTAEQEADLTRLREIAYKTVFKHTANPELCAYVSEDFDLIGRGVLLSSQESFLSDLLNEYVEGRIPFGAIARVQVGLMTMVERMQMNRSER